MANRDILKEAIADAKSIKEAAIANAKVALEEAFTPYLKEKLSAKLAEIDAMDEEMDENKAMDEAEIDEYGDEHPMSTKDALKEKSMDEEMDETMDEEMDEVKKSMDEMDLDELLRELEDMDEEMDENMDETINDPRGPGAHGNIAPTAQSDTDLNEAKEGEEEESEEEDVEIDIENMSEEDLKSFIESVIADMVKAGELEAGHEGMENEEGAEEESEEEEEVSIDELMHDINEAKKATFTVPANDADDLDDEAKYFKSLLKKAKIDATVKAGIGELEITVDSSDEAKAKQAVEDAGYSLDEAKMKEEMNKMKKELEEAYEALAKVKSEINEVNLLNSKLLYLNKVFKAKNLTESQKVKVLAAFDKATSKKEAQLVYETVMESLNNTNNTKRPVTESVRGMASKVISGTANSTKQPIIEVNAAFERMQKLAGIKK
jgi:hypothetical protein